MFRPTFEVADVISRYLNTTDKSKLFGHHWRTLHAIRCCRTSALGTHTDQCDSCDFTKISYNSCRNRHCPKCQGVQKEMWIIQQEEMLLPVAYFHVVFTLPHELNQLCMYNQKLMYNLLFKAAWHTIKTLAADHQWLGAKSSATMVLHTWSQTLMLHPHLHCIVPNGGLDKNNQWRFPKKGNANFLFPVLAMNKLFRGFYLNGLKEYFNLGVLDINFDQKQQWKSFINKLYAKEWVVYTKKPFSTVNHVVNYLARYSHRVAITNHRITSIKNNEVTFEYKDYKDFATKKLMTLSVDQFMKRFCLHILEPRYRKIRQFGMTSNASKATDINNARLALGEKIAILHDRNQRKILAIQRLFKEGPNTCKNCKNGTMVTVQVTQNKDPPNQIVSCISLQ